MIESCSPKIYSLSCPHKGLMGANGQESIQMFRQLFVFPHCSFNSIAKGILPTVFSFFCGLYCAPALTGPLSDRASDRPLAPLEGLLLKDRYVEHAKITKIEYESSGCAWGCQNFYAQIGLDHKIEFYGAPVHAGIEQFGESAQGFTNGVYFGQVDGRKVYYLREFLVQSGLVEQSGLYHSNATDTNSRYFSITYEGKSTLVAMHGWPGLYHVGMTEFLIRELIETAEYRVPADYQIRKSDVISDNRGSIKIENISRNEANLLIEFFQSTSSRAVTRNLPPELVEKLEIDPKTGLIGSLGGIDSISRRDNTLLVELRKEDCENVTLKMKRTYCGRTKCEFRIEDALIHAC